MADYIYNEFPNEPEDNENFFDDKPKRSADEIAHRRNNTLLIVVSAFFATLLILFVLLGTIVINNEKFENPVFDFSSNMEVITALDNIAEWDSSLGKIDVENKR